VRKFLSYLTYTGLNYTPPHLY